MYKMLAFQLSWRGLSFKSLSLKKLIILPQLSCTNKLQSHTTKVNLGTIADVKRQNIMLTPR